MPKADVGVSRILGPATALAVGLSVSVALSVLVIGPEVLRLLGEDGPVSFLLGALLFLPLVFAWLEAAGTVRAGASLYEIARARDKPLLTLAVGWTSLGGYLAVAMLLVEAIVACLDTLSRALLQLELQEPWLVLFVVAMAALHETAGSQRGWRTRAVLVFTFVIAFLLLAISTLIEGAGEAMPFFDSEDLYPWLHGIAFTASSLWALDLILGHRGQMRAPERTMPIAVLSCWFGGVFLGGIATFAIARHPELSERLRETGFALGEHRVDLLVAALGTLLCGGGLFRVLAAGQRLARRLQIDGLLPGSASERPRSAAQITVLLGFSVLVAAGTSTLGHRSLINFASLSVLSAIALVLIPIVLRRPDAAPGGWRLPLHPLIPGLGAATALYFAIRLRYGDATVAIGWLLAGLLVLLLYSRKGSLAARRREFVFEDLSRVDPGTAVAQPVLVATGGGGQALSLIRAGATLAEFQETELRVLRVVPFVERLAPEEQQELAKQALSELEELVREAGIESVTVHPLVRMAPTPEAGIVSASRELGARAILLGWPEELADSQVVARVFPAISASLGILRGQVREETRDVLVATAGGPHAPAALDLGAAFAGSEGRLELATVRTPRTVRTGQEVLEETIARSKGVGELRTLILEGPSVVEALAGMDREVDLVLLGASTDRFFNVNRLEGVASEVAEARSGATLVVKRKERASLFLVRRVWNPLDRFLPDLSVKEKAAVLSSMRHLARADTDFFVLISLASIIASFGLLLDSGAVIIGAMLVAPLMSPILALAQGIVQGNLRLIRRAATSVAQGTATCILIATGIGLLFPGQGLSGEMLARGEPNLLDLCVALAAGAAAAYAISRSGVSAALPGVAISVALVPPLCVVGLGLGMAHLRVAGGALLLYFTNLVGIVLVGGAVFLLLGFRPTRSMRGGSAHRGIRWALVAILLTSIPLTFQTRASLEEARLRHRVERALEGQKNPDLHVIATHIGRSEEGPVVDLTVVAFDTIAAPEQKVEELREWLERAVGFPVKVRVSLLEGVRYSSASEE